MDCNGRVDNITKQLDGPLRSGSGDAFEYDAGQSTLDPLNPPLIIVLDAVPSAENSTDFRGKPNLVDGWSDLYHKARAYATGIEDFLRLHSPLGRTYAVKCQCKCSNGTDCDMNNMTTRWITVQPDLVVTSYYSLVSDDLPTTLAPATVAADKETTVIEVAFSIPPGVAELGHVKREYIGSIMSSLGRYGDETAANGTDARGFTVSYTVSACLLCIMVVEMRDGQMCSLVD